MAEMYSIGKGTKLAPGGPTEVGNKAWNLIRMAQGGLPVPAVFVLPTAWCGQTDAAASLNAVLADGVRILEAAKGLVFGACPAPVAALVRHRGGPCGSAQCYHRAARGGVDSDRKLADRDGGLKRMKPA